jgi:hypothetical protein
MVSVRGPENSKKLEGKYHVLLTGRDPLPSLQHGGCNGGFDVCTPCGFYLRCGRALQDAAVTAAVTAAATALALSALVLHLPLLT